jgi:hypothetical protein
MRLAVLIDISSDKLLPPGNLEPTAGGRGAIIACPDWHVLYASYGTYLFRLIVTTDKPAARPY